MKKIIFMCLASSLVLVGCSKDDGKSAKAKAPTAIPDSLEPKVEAAAPLTEQQKTSIRATFTKMTLVSEANDLAYSPTDEKAEDAAKRIDRLDKATPETKALITRIKQQCTIHNSETTSDNKNQMPTAGSKTNSETKSSITGQRCPVDSSNVSNSQITYEEVNLQAKRVSFQVSGGSRSLTVVKDENLRKLSGLVSTSVSLNYAGPARYSDDKTTSYIEGSGPIVIETLQGKITGEIKMRSLSREGDQSTSMIMKLNHFGAVIAISAFQRKQGTRETGEVYLNGEKTTPEALKDLFGSSFSVNGNH